MQEWGCLQFCSTFCKTHRFPYGKKKLSAQGSEATLSEANARVAFWIAAFTAGKDRGGSGGGDKFRIAQKLYGANRFFILP